MKTTKRGWAGAAQVGNARSLIRGAPRVFPAGCNGAALNGGGRGCARADCGGGCGIPAGVGGLSGGQLSGSGGEAGPIQGHAASLAADGPVLPGNGRFPQGANGPATVWPGGPRRGGDRDPAGARVGGFGRHGTSRSCPRRTPQAGAGQPGCTGRVGGGLREGRQTGTGAASVSGGTDGAAHGCRRDGGAGRTGGVGVAVDAGGGAVQESAGHFARQRGGEPGVGAGAVTTGPDRGGDSLLAACGAAAAGRLGAVQVVSELLCEDGAVAGDDPEFGVQLTHARGRRGVDGLDGAGLRPDARRGACRAILPGGAAARRRATLRRE